MIIPRHEFYFLRHGETEHNAKNILSDFDVSINQMGERQAYLIKPLISSLPIQTICHSPLKRVKETMAIAASALNVKQIQINDLRECTSDVLEDMITVQNETIPIKKVEGFFSQTLDGIRLALSYTAPVLVIAHWGIHWALCHKLSIADHNWDIDNCALIHFLPVAGNRWTAKLLNLP
ncbi:MAG: histidine phosphatase family protein [Simkania negevensis]|nr:histidine phosphatase family protein [Simkania negevensis]